MYRPFEYKHVSYFLDNLVAHVCHKIWHDAVMLLAYDVDVAFHGVLAQEKILHPLTPTCPSHPEFQCCFFFMGASGAKGGKKKLKPRVACQMF